MRRPLRDFQHITGYLNLALNMYPYLRPGLCALYAKTAGKLFQKALLWVNRDVERELTCIVNHLLHSVIWSYDDLSSTILHVYCNTSPFAIGFWYPSLALGFQAPAHQIFFAQQVVSIFYLESLYVCAAILDVAPCLSPNQCLATSQTTSILSSCSIRSQHYLHSTGF